MRRVAVVAYARTELYESSPLDEVELVCEAVSAVRAQTGLRQADIGFTVSGSCDFLAGRPFAFVSALDGVGAWPPIRESHLEMDGAFALYDAYVRLQLGDLDTALVYAFGQPSLGDLNRVASLQFDPHFEAPLGLDEAGLAGIQAAEGQAAGWLSKEAATLTRLPLRDAAAAVILAAEGRAEQLCERPAWIAAIAHRIDRSDLGGRNLAALGSASAAASAIGLDQYRIDQVALAPQFAHQRPLLKRALKLPADLSECAEAQAVDPFMVSGLIRIGAAATEVHKRAAECALAHAGAGPALQQNLLCVLEAGR
jgi:hypothetical protein